MIVHIMELKLVTKTNKRENKKSHIVIKEYKASGYTVYLLVNMHAVFCKAAYN